MNKKGRPIKSADDTRALLICAARRKFVSKSYDKVSIRELAQLAGVNSAMIKYYFQSKEGLYKAMIMEVTGQVMESFAAHLQNTEIDNLEDFFRSFVDVIKQSPEFPLLMLKEMVLGQGVCRDYILHEIGAYHIKIFDRIYLRFKQAGRLKQDVDPILFRMSLMGLTLFPWYMRSLVSEMEGITYDDEFLESMIKHNSNLMQSGCFIEDQKQDVAEKDGE